MKGLLNILVPALLATAAPALAGDAAGARRAMDAGRRALERGAAAEAVSAFAHAAEQAAETSLDPAAARYNQALALARAERSAEALQAFGEARHTTDLALQFRALYGEACLRHREAEAALATNGVARALEGWDVARALLRQAMVLEPADGDAKVNYELAGLRLAEVRGAVTEAEEVLRRAKAAVAGGRLDEAARWLAEEPAHRAWAFAQQPALQKKFEDMARRVAELIGIREGGSAAGGVL